MPRLPIALCAMKLAVIGVIESASLSEPLEVHQTSIGIPLSA
jgi:hypothetical protein